MREVFTLSLGELLEACACQPKVAPPLGKRSCNQRQQACWPPILATVSRARSSARYTDCAGPGSLALTKTPLPTTAQEQVRKGESLGARPLPSTQRVLPSSAKA
eukprot:3512422-Amphidinium_carterae.1